MQRSDVLGLLRRETVDVEFVKVNGDLRVLTCTLDPTKLPSSKPLEEQAEDKVENPDFCAVFDMINQGWRSFRWNSVLTVNGELYLN